MLCCLLLTGCFSRQEIQVGEERPTALQLLAASDSAEALAELYAQAEANLVHLPLQLRGGLADLPRVLARLSDRTQAFASADPAGLQAALAPWRSSVAGPELAEVIKLPADTALAPLVAEANRVLQDSWRLDRAARQAAQIERRLLLSPPCAERACEADVLARSAATVTELLLMLEHARDALELLNRLDVLQSRAQLLEQGRRETLAAEPGRARVLADDLELLASLRQTLRHTRAHLADGLPRQQGLLLQASERLEMLDSAWLLPAQLR